MKSFRKTENFCVCLATPLMIFAFQQENKEVLEAAPPITEKNPHEIVSHGQSRIDNYFWMRLSEEQKNAEEKDEQTRKVFDYLEAENEYRQAMLAHTEDFQKELYEEMKGRIPQKDESVPYEKKGYWSIPVMKKGRSILSTAAKMGIWRRKKR